MRRTTIRLAALISLFAGCTSKDSIDVSDSGKDSPVDTEMDTEPDTDPDTDSDSDTDTFPPPDTEETGDTDPEPPVNLLQDPSFEEGASAWNIWGGAERVENEANLGDWALKATQVNGAEQLVEGLEPNTTYRLSGWARTTGENPISIGVKKHGNPESKVTFTDSEYTEQEMTFTTGFGSTSAIIYAYKHSGESAGYADDLSLTYESESAYNLIWSDEFDGTGSPDSTKWGFEEGFVRNEEAQWYQPDNAFLENGDLVIEGRKESRPNPNYEAGSSSWKTNRETIEYTSSSLRSEGLFSWQYGRMVVRAKVTNLTGTWPAIWTLGNSCEWPSNGEVDVMENYGGKIWANFAWGTNTRWKPNWDSSTTEVSSLPKSWTDDYHIWELDWTESQMKIYLDGVLLNSVNLSGTINGSAACEGQNPFQQPHFLLLNLALGSNGGSVDALSFPTQYRVDYVRIYQP